MSSKKPQPIIRNHEMLNQVQHDNGGKFSVTLNSGASVGTTAVPARTDLFQGLMNTEYFPS